VRALVIFMAGIILVLAFMQFVKYYFGNPYRLIFYTVEVKGKSFDDVVNSLLDRLKANGLPVKKVLNISKAINERGSSFNKYTIILACDIPQKEELLARIPSFTNLLPCSIAVYETPEGVKITALKEIVFLAEESHRLEEKDISLIIDTYRALRKSIDEAVR